VNHCLSIDCGTNLNKANWHEYRGRNSMIIMPISHRALVSGLWDRTLTKSDRTFSTSTELGLPLEATAADSAIE
jgi:hypothetical protein